MKRLRLSRRMALLTVVILGVFGGAARAYFTATGAGTASARVGTLSPPSNVTATTYGSAGVSISWDAPTTGISPEGYYLLRNKSGAAPAPACVTSATSLRTSTSCNDLDLPDGTYTYTVVAKYRSFTASANSSPVTVINDNTAPGVTLTSPAHGSATATTTPTISGAAGDATGDLSDVTVKIYNGTGTGGTVDQTLDVTRSGASWSTSATTLAPGTYTVQATQADTDGNIGTSTANTFVLDTSAPTLSTLQMFDSDANGKVDEVKATFTEPVAASTATAPWTLTNVPSDGALSAVSTSGSGATLTISEGSGAADSSVASFNVALAASASIRDAAGNQASFAATAPTDLAKPALRTLQMFDSDASGKVDEVKATFTEPLATSTPTTTEPWTLTNVPSDGALSAVSTSGSGATLTISEGSGAADTSVASFNVALAASASIRDAAANEASFAATTPSDLAGPVLMTATSGSGTTTNTTNLMQVGDTLALTFSEALAPSTVPGNPAVTESRSSSTGTLTITGLIIPTTIDFKYLDKNDDSATSSTTSALSNSNQTVTVTLSAITTNGSVAVGSGGASIFPAASLKDPAGNAAPSASPATARLVSPLF